MRSELQILPLALLCVLGGVGRALEIRSYDPADHDRFLGTLAAPVKNPGQLYSGLDLSGIGWFAPSPDVQFALVSREHVVFATHFSPALGNSRVYFLNAAGGLVFRNLSSERDTIVEDGQPSDLTLIRLSAPLDEDSGVSPLPYLDLASDAGYLGETIGVAGQGPVSNGIQVIGRDTLDDVEPLPRGLDYGPEANPITLTSRFIRFDYLPTGTADEGKLEIGDSGSPTFVEANGRAALVGTHSYVMDVDGPGPNDAFENYDVFLPHYIGELDALLAPLGYRMRPVNAPSTTLSGAGSTVEATPRRANPLTLEFELENTGTELTGNLEVEFAFPAGQEPDSVAAAGWVVAGSGGQWTLRKATLAGSATATLAAEWDAAPALDELTPTVTWRSDTVAEASISPVIPLAPSFAEWAAGLAAAGELDDPDGDGVANLLEYAFGGDPEDGLNRNANGDPLLPRVRPDGGDVTLVFPERDDKLLRGLDYIVEYSTDLVGWTTTAPAGTSSSTATYSPAIPGFVERTVRWPGDGVRRFARVGVVLAE